MSIKTDTNKSLQPVAISDASRPELEAGEQAVLPRHSPEPERMGEGGSLDDNARASMPKEAELIRHRALWEKQIKATEKQIATLEKGKEDRGVYSWLVGTDAADDKALASAKSHLEELKKSAKELRETGNLDKSKSEFKRLAGERGEVLEQTAENYEKVAVQADGAGEAVRTTAVTGLAMTATGGVGLIAGVGTAIAGGLYYDAAQSVAQSSSIEEVGEKFLEKATAHIGEDALSGVIAGGTTLASLKFAGSLAPKIQGMRALGVFGEKGSEVVARGLIGSTAGAVGAGANTGITTEIARQRAISEHQSSGSTQPLEEFLTERGLSRDDQLKGIGQSMIAGTAGGFVGGSGAYIREGIVGNSAKALASRAGIKTAELGLAGGAGLGVSALDGEITADEIVSEAGSAVFGDLLGEMVNKQVTNSEGEHLSSDENGSYNRIGGTDIGGIATAHPEFGTFVEQVSEQGFAVRIDESKGDNAHVDVNAKEVVIGSETSWATLQHESAHVDLYRSVQDNAGGDLVDSARQRNYSEIDSLDSSDSLLANALRVAKGAGLSDKATHETVAVMRELETLRAAGVPETDIRYRETMDYALAYWEGELSKIPEGQLTPEQKTALVVTKDSRSKLNLSEEISKNHDDIVYKSEKEEGVYRSQESTSEADAVISMLRREEFPSEEMLTPEVLADPKVQIAAREAMVEYLKGNFVEDAEEIRGLFNISEESLQDSSVQEVAREQMLKVMMKERVNDARKIRDVFCVSETVVLEVAREVMAVKYQDGDMDAGDKIAEAFKVREGTLQDSSAQSKGLERMMSLLQEGNIEEARSVRDSFAVSEEALRDRNVQAIVIAKMFEMLEKGNAHGAEEIREIYRASEASLQESSVQNLARERMMKLLQEDDLRGVKNIRDIFDVSRKSLQDPISQALACEKMIEMLEKGSVSSSKLIREVFGVSEESLRNPNMQRLAREAMVAKINDDNFIESQTIRNVFSVPDEFVFPIVGEAMVKSLRNKDLDRAKNIRDLFRVPDAYLQSPNVQATALDGMRQVLMNNNLDYEIDTAKALQIGNIFRVSDSVVYEVACVAISEYLRRGEVFSAEQISTKLKVPDAMIRSEEVQTAAVEGIVKYLRESRHDLAQRLIAKFQIPETVMMGEVVQPVVVEAVFRRLREGRSEIAQELIAKFQVPETVIMSEEVQTAAVEGIIKCIREGNVDSAQALATQFQIPETIMTGELVQPVVVEAVVRGLREGRYGLAQDLVAKFQVPETVIRSEEVQTVAVAGIIKCLREGNLDSAQALANKFQVPETVIRSEEVQTAAVAGIIKCLREGNLDSAQALANKFQIPETVMMGEVVQPVLAEAVVRGLREGRYDFAQDLVAKFQVPEIVIRSQEVQTAAVERALKCREEGYVAAAKEIATIFQIPETVFSEEVVQAEARRRVLSEIDSDDGSLKRAEEILRGFGFSGDIVIEEIRPLLVDCLKKNKLERVQKIIEALQISREGIRSSGLESEVHEIINDRYFYSGNFELDEVAKIAKVFLLSEGTVLEIAKDRISDLVIKGGVHDIEEVMRVFGVSKFNLVQPEFQSRIADEMIDFVECGGTASRLAKIRDFFELAEEIFQDSHYQTRLREALASSLEELDEGYFSNVKEIMELYQLPEVVFSEPEFQTAGRVGMLYLIRMGSIDELREMRKSFKFPKEVFQEPEFQTAAREAMLSSVRYGRLDKIREIREFFKFPKEILQEPEFQSAVRGAMLSSVRYGDLDQASQVREYFRFSKEIFQEPEFQTAAREAMVKQLNDLDLTKARRFLEVFMLSDTVVRDLSCGAIAYHLNKGSIPSVLEICREFKLSEEIFQEPVIQTTVCQIIAGHLRSDNLENAEKIRDRFKVSEDRIKEPEIQTAAREAMASALQRPEPNLETVRRREEEFKISSSWENLPFNENFRRMNGNFGIRSIDEYVSFCSQHPDYISALREGRFVPTLSRDDLALIDKSPFRMLEAEEISNGEVGGWKTLLASNDYEEIYNRLKSKSKEWKDVESVQKPFEKLADVIGYRRAFEYGSRKGLSRHDAYFEGSNIVRLCKASGLTPQAFYQNILAQVAKDTATYPEGTAYHRINALVREVKLAEATSVIEKVKSYDITKLTRLAEDFSDVSSVCSSWKNLKRYYEIQRMLAKTELLESMQRIKESGDEMLYQYAENLAFHEGSDVAIKDIEEFILNPESFLSRDDDHSKKLHALKKPSNYLEFPNLDLTATELRNALVHGALDTIQVFSPMSIRYEVTASGHILGNPREELRYAMGSMRDASHWNSQRRKRLFAEANKVLKEEGVDIIGYLQGAKDASAEAESRILTLLGDKQYNVRAGEDRFTIQARIHRKSSSDGVIAGNDTACCMPFGSGKNNVYMFNPDTAQFTVELIKSEADADGEVVQKTKTLAQSVLLKSRDVGVSVPEIMSRVGSSNAGLSDLVSEEILRHSPAYILADNVEVAPNYRQGIYPSLVEAVYRDFFSEYMGRFGDAENLHQDFIPIGQNYSTTIQHLPTVPNTFVPLAPVSYSDNNLANSYRLDVSRDTSPYSREIVVDPIARPETRGEFVKGVSELSFLDTLPVAYLEGKAYESNPSLIQYLHNMENGLIAKDINNSAKGRPNMSFKYSTPDGKVLGYMLAYEGKLGEEGTPGIYISDLAADPESFSAGGRLISAFTKAYGEHYLSKGNLLPIYGEMREETSYRLVQRKLSKIGEELGIKFQMQDQGTYQHGNDTMHRVLIVPVRDSEVI